MDKVAVRKAVGVQYPVTGAPILVTGGGGRGRGAVGVTRGQRALGALGMLAGAAGALTGQHRSLGGLVQSAISGGAQGSALGRGVGRALTTRTGQARADLREQAKQARAMERAAALEEARNRGDSALQIPIPGRGAIDLNRLNPMAAVRRRNTAVADRREQELDRVNRANRAMQVAVQQSGQEYGRQGRQARRVAEARARAMAGEDVARDVEFAQAVRDRFTGMTDNDVQERAAMGAAAAASPDEAVRVDPPLAEFEERPPANVSADNTPVAVIGPGTPMNALPAPLTVGTVGQDIAAEEATPTGDAADHDGEYQTFGLGQGDSEQGISDLQTRAFSGMSQSEQRRKEEEEFRAAQAQQNPQRRLVGVD